jgi:ketosteroid isomerase-like protein
MLATLALAATLSAADCAALAESARPAIDHANGDWVRALKAGDADAIAAAYAEDGLFQKPDGTLIVGRAGVRDLYAAAAPKSATIAAGGIVTEGIACGDAHLLYEWGHGWLTTRSADGRLLESGGPYLTVWKQVGSEWKIVRNLTF